MTQEDVERALRGLGLIVVSRGKWTGNVYFATERDWDVPRLRMQERWLRVVANGDPVGPRVELSDWAAAVRVLWEKMLDQDRILAPMEGRTPAQAEEICRAHLRRTVPRMALFLGV